MAVSCCTRGTARGAGAAGGAFCVVAPFLAAASGRGVKSGVCGAVGQGAIPRPHAASSAAAAARAAGAERPPPSANVASAASAAARAWRGGPGVIQPQR